MLAGEVYPVLAKLLEEWRLKSSAELAAWVAREAWTGEALVHGEVLNVEVGVKWADSMQAEVIVEAVAYGPSHWLTERVEERVRVQLVENSGHAAP